MIISIIFVFQTLWNKYNGKLNWRDDPRFRTFLAKKTLTDLFKIYFQREYDEEEAQQREKQLKHILTKYKKQDTLFKRLLDNNEDEFDEPLPNMFLDTLSEETIRHVLDPTPDNMLTFSKLLIEARALQLACEVIFCSVSLVVEEFITNHQLNVILYSDIGKRRFSRELSSEMGHQFAVFESCHESFYTNSHGVGCVHYALEEAQGYIKQLRALHLSDEKKKQLENDNFEN
ncbi:hypothetical protein B9Z55_023796 [Caenorhabditis nigoni]|uniref:Uncharacterized protein n=1 Tax=Caenorhabditis nigoni TaxID=1611254 RepID=A0A2G5SR68_9PELO|nr:hypothetical protein B9Z55_023796 [Caenorhabditis nigoni]